MKEEVIDKDIVAGRMGREYVKTALYAFPALKVMAEEVGEHVKRKAYLSYDNRVSCENLAVYLLEQLELKSRIETLSDTLGGVVDKLSGSEKFLLQNVKFRTIICVIIYSEWIPMAVKDSVILYNLPVKKENNKKENIILWRKNGSANSEKNRSKSKSGYQIRSEIDGGEKDKREKDRKQIRGGEKNTGHRGISVQGKNHRQISGLVL